MSNFLEKSKIMNEQITIARKVGKDRWRYILVDNAQPHELVVQMLMTFYQEKERVDELLALGNLTQLGPSPINVWKGEGDKINCISNIRDSGREVLLHEASETVSLNALYKKADRTYVFDDDEWYIMNYDQSFDKLKRLVEPIKVPPVLKGIVVKYLDGNYLYDKHDINTKEKLLEEVEKSGKIHYLFKNYRLVEIVKPQNKQ